jgi:hypothetical protein
VLQTKLQLGRVLADGLAGFAGCDSRAGAARLYSRMRTAVVDKAVKAAEVLVQTHIRVAEAAADQLEQQQQLQAQPPTAADEAWASSDVQQLPLVYLACWVERLHADTQSNASKLLRAFSTQEHRQHLQARLAVPPLHRQLLEVLSMPLEDLQRQKQLEGWPVEAAANAVHDVVSCMAAVAIRSELFQQPESELSMLEWAVQVLEEE